MRQAGVLAVCGLISVQSMITRLSEDHTHTLMLATALKDVPGLQVNLSNVHSNILFVGVDSGVLGVDADQLKVALKDVVCICVVFLLCLCCVCAVFVMCCAVLCCVVF